MEVATVAHGHGAKGVAMVGAGQADEAGAPGMAGQLPVLKGKLERDLDGIGAVIAEEDPVEIAGGCARQRGGKLRAGLVGQPEHRGVGHPPNLVDQRAVQIRIIVTMHIGPDGGIAIEVATALGIGQPAALSRCDRQWRQAQVLLHLRERMPDVPAVPAVNLIRNLLFNSRFRKNRGCAFSHRQTGKRVRAIAGPGIC